MKWMIEWNNFKTLNRNGALHVPMMIMWHELRSLWSLYLFYLLIHQSIYGVIYAHGINWRVYVYGFQNISTALLSFSISILHLQLPSRYLYLEAFVFVSWLLKTKWTNNRTSKKSQNVNTHTQIHLLSSFRDGLFQHIEILVTKRICVLLQTF